MRERAGEAGPAAAGEVILRCDGSDTVGFGHLFRCLAIATELARRGWKPCTFLMAGDHRVCARLVQARGHGFVPLDTPAGGVLDAERTRSLARERAARVIADSHAFDRVYFERLRPCRPPIVSFDDDASATHMSDIVVNYNPGAEHLPLRTARHTTRLLGPRYFTLDERFLVARRAPAAAVKATADTLAIALGGAPDPGTVASVLHGVRIWLDEAPGRHVRLFAGVSPPRAHLARFEALLGPRATLVCDPPDLPHALARADFALVNGSIMGLEAAAVGLPLLVTAVAQNQRLAAEAFGHLGIGVPLPPADACDAQTSLIACRQLSADQARRHALRAAALALLDGRGSARIVDAMQAWSPTPSPASGVAPC